MSSSEVRHKVARSRAQFLEQPLNMNRLRCLGLVLYMSTERRPHCTLLSEEDNDWKMVLDGR